MNFSAWTGRHALVTGASSGFGIDFARQLAAAGVNLVLAARRQDLLEALADELRRAFPVEVQVIPCDLSNEDQRNALFAATEGAGHPVDILINNAGFGVYGRCHEVPWEKERQMLEVDVVALAHLSRLFSAAMVARRRGWILHLASIAAYQPSPRYATYAAAKAMVLSHGLALRQELKPLGVTVSVLAPGPASTAFHDIAGRAPQGWMKWMLMPSNRIVRAGLKALAAGRSQVVPGAINAWMAFSTRFLPRPWQAAIAASLVRD